MNYDLAQRPVKSATSPLPQQLTISQTLRLYNLQYFLHIHRVPRHKLQQCNQLKVIHPKRILIQAHKKGPKVQVNTDDLEEFHDAAEERNFYGQDFSVKAD